MLGIRGLPLQPPCEVDADLMSVAREDFGDAIVEVAMATGAPALQMGRLADVGAVIRSAVEKRIGGKRLEVEADWRRLLDEHLAKQGAGKGSEALDELEKAAREDKDSGVQ